MAALPQIVLDGPLTAEANEVEKTGVKVPRKATAEFAMPVERIGPGKAIKVESLHSNLRCHGQK